MTKNIGRTERILRIIVGAGLLLGFALNPSGAWSFLYLIGLVPLVTALMGSCPAYTLLGISTCRHNDG